jgi:hypothetical protein
MKDFKHYLSLINESKTMSITFGDYKIDFKNKSKSILEGSVDFPNKHSAYIITTDNGETFEVSMMKNRKLLFDTSINSDDYIKDKGVWKGLSSDDVRSLLIDISDRP